MEWISCKERMPAHGQHIRGRAICGGFWGEIFDKDEPKGKMTHWKPDPITSEEDEKEDVYVDIGFRKNNATEDYILRTVRLQSVKDRTMAEIHKMLESEDDTTNDS